VTPTPSDLELFQALVAKQSSALATLYDRYGDLMYGLAYKILGSQQEAEDLIQEVFLGIWRNCNYNPARGSLRSFLMILVRSRAIDRF
jgi:RNA polymerase sigma-70 factor (ECF subfamily)